MTIGAVVFDWGGTLTPYVPVDPALAWRDAARCLAPKQADLLVGALCRAEAALWASVEHDACSGSLHGLLETVAADLGVSPPPARLAEAQACYLRAWGTQVEHRADAIAAITALRDRGLKIGLLSNTVLPGSFHDEVLARDGIRDLIDVRLYTSELAWMKPRPEAFAAVLDALGVGAKSAVFVGDRLFDDIFGAQRAGMWAVHLPNEFVTPYDVEPDARIGSLSEVAEVVDRWAALSGSGMSTLGD